MKKLLIIILLSLATFNIKSQVVYSDPEFPTVTDEITIYFNAIEGDGGLQDYSGDIYAHAGLITSESSSSTDWKYVLTAWSENTTTNKLSKVSDNLYSFTISPNITDFYGVSSNEQVLQLAFVFRSADGSVTGRDANGSDILYDIYEEGLNTKVNNPAHNAIYKVNTIISINVSSNEATKTYLLINSDTINSTTTSSIEYNWTPATKGNYIIKSVATDGPSTVIDSAWVYIYDKTTTQALPANVIKGINYIDDTTVTLVLYAPYKTNAFVIGDFNNWLTAEDNMMKRTADGKTFWLTITHLEKGKEYAFQYLIDGELRIADPYTQMILDQSNDKYITDDIYPDLISYPDGKTTEIASVLQTGQTEYDWQVTDFKPAKTTDLIIYEMLIRDFTEKHTFKSIADTLNYLQRLGINALELMPINEFEGNSSWGYNPSFYFATDKYYGSKEDLKFLVDECHKRSIAVIIDLVLNHSFGQSPFVRLYWDKGNSRPSTLNPWYNTVSNFENPDAQWGYDFNHESIYTQELVDSINSYWMNEFNIDGFRFDFTKGFSNTSWDESSWGSDYDEDRIAILERMADEIWKRNSNTIVIFEHLSDNPEEKELANHGILLWGNMNDTYCEAAMGWNSGSKSDFSWISYLKRGWDSPHVVGYMESHDEERLMYKNLQWGNAESDYDITNLYTALNRIELVTNFFLTLPGPKMIWQFGELGYDYTIDYNDRTGEKPIRWDYWNSNSRQRVFDTYAALNKLRIEEDAFETTDYDLSLSGTTKSIHLNHNDMNVVILGNFDVMEQNIDPAFQNTGTWYEYYTGATLNITDVNTKIALAPGEYRLYTTKQFAVPDINTDISTTSASSGNLHLYPNPAAENLYIENISEYETMAIYNNLGQIVWYTNELSGTNTININNFKQGVYLVTATDSKGNTITCRFLKN